ncbi:MAG: F0F1 ATP synthase subunit B [Clostridia bacterium]|nr:F0F1 ATP synthase subunit B [Clostridia bacterium]
MQSLDVISINLWQILISLINLLLIFFIIKKFLFKPVKKLFATRQAELDDRYASAENAEKQALVNKDAWEQKMQSAEAEAKTILQSATENAKYRGEKIVEEARTRADSILRQAEIEASLERKKAEDGIRREIVEVSGALTEKMLGREINTQDHRVLIDSFIDEIGNEDDTDR